MLTTTKPRYLVACLLFIIPAFVQAQLSKLPALFLSTGSLSKKAKEMLGKEFKGMVVKQI